MVATKIIKIKNEKLYLSDPLFISKVSEFTINNIIGNNIINPPNKGVGKGCFFLYYLANHIFLKI